MLLGYADFKFLAATHQKHYVHRHGQYLAQRWHKNYSVELYTLGSFYAERWLEQECREPERVKAHATAACLVPYVLSAPLSPTGGHP
ncbi:hypothetical protein P1X16_28840 [Hymenobacter sp. YC55]|nr:hypothetical protein [Hymenobacter sp. YC55]